MPRKLSDRERLLSEVTYADPITKKKPYTTPTDDPNGFAIIDAGGDFHHRIYCNFCDFTAATQADIRAHEETAHRCEDCGNYSQLKPWYSYAVKPPIISARVCPLCLINRKKAEYAKRRADVVS